MAASLARIRAATFIAVLGVGPFLLGGWTAVDLEPLPPTCTTLDTLNESVLTSPTIGAPVYIRWCGRARATLFVNRRRYVIRGGACLPSGWYPFPRQSRELRGFGIGLLAEDPSRPIGLAIDVNWHRAITRAGRVIIVDSTVQVPGTRMGAYGSVIVKRGLARGTFELFGLDSSGPTGVRITGSWACG